MAKTEQVQELLAKGRALAERFETDVSYHTLLGAATLISWARLIRDLCHQLSNEHMIASMLSDTRLLIVTEPPGESCPHWIAKIPTLSDATWAYGTTRSDAIRRVQQIALAICCERMRWGVEVPEAVSLLFHVQEEENK